ncbi:N-acetylaspartate synthetase [Fundulus heteroclitus]|uniref:N-acetylaspartate synthetase n=1 Tax=Fundulus heteroclitus TaxID=8078 RepID=UPI00165CE19C|nr:N-acetylaspartate synthetase [Fundulus heteroclitus]
MECQFLRTNINQLLSCCIICLCGLSCSSSSGSCLWVAELEGNVVGAVAAVRLSDDVVELLRMCVDRSYRRCGVGVVLGQKVLQFAEAHRYASVVLGTTAYTPAAHQLYKRLGFHCVGVTNGYVTPGSSRSFLEQIFYRVKHHHYRRNVLHSKITSKGQH